MEVSDLQAAWYAGKIAIDEGGVVPGTRQGTRIGPYEVGRFLGAGAMAAVHEAVRATDGRRVALKLLDPALALNPAARARFLEEAKLSARLRDPRVVEVLDSGEADDQVYLAMELLEGEDLAQRLQRDGALPVDEVAEILIPVCEAVAMAHRRGVTHRDLKPSNIFLAVRSDRNPERVPETSRDDSAGQSPAPSTRDGRVEPVVLDFGIAKQGDEAPPAGDTAARPLFGTPLYLAPELVANPQAASPASDQYALGVILYQALTGEPPYAAADLPELLALIAAGDPRPPRARRAEISLDLDAVVQRAMSREPDERFPSVSDLGRALAPFAPADRPVSGRRRALSSPAIEVEAAVPSPFLKTLSPDAHPDSGGWFVAPPPPEPAAVVAPPPVDPAPVLPPVIVSPALTAVVPRRPPAVEAPDEELGAPVPASSGRRRLVVLSAVALGGLALLFVARAGRPVRNEPPAVVAAPAPPPAPAPPVQPAPPPPVAAAAPAEPAPEAPPPPEPARAPAPEPVRVAAPEPTTAPAVQPARAAAPEPARTPTPERAPVRTREALAEPAAPPADHVSKPRPRPRQNTEVRMHNGVPLLD